MLNRRKFFTRVGASAAISFPYVSIAASGFTLKKGRKPARIIHMVADGLSSGTLTCADYLSRVVRNRGLTWLSLLTREGVRMGLMNMRSLDSMVTDSSAASSSWGSGSRVTNGAVNLLPSGRVLTPLYTLFREHGWKRGLVTTTEITHATPAGFATALKTRDDAEEIASQYLASGVDVLLGGGSKFFVAKKRKDKRNLRAEFASVGYSVLSTAQDLESADPHRKWLGTFSESHLPYRVDAQADTPSRNIVPPLAFMARRALHSLGRHDHFILQIEGGRVDHGAHNCDASAALREVIAFDEAIDGVLEFTRKYPDTLVVITTDHGTGNMGANGTGTRYKDTSKLFAQIANVNASFPVILKRIKKQQTEAEDKEDDGVATASESGNGSTNAALAAIAAAAGNGATASALSHLHGSASATNGNSALASTATAKTSPTAKADVYVPEAAHIQQVLSDALGCKVSSKHAKLLENFLVRKSGALYDQLNSETGQLGLLLGNYTGVGWTSGSHTADYVPIAAFGPGSEHFAGFIQNTDVFRHYTRLAGIDFENPTEPEIASNSLPETRDHAEHDSMVIG